MKKLFALLFYLLPTSNLLFCQLEPIVVTEQAIKVGNEEELYFGFAEGDEIILDLEVVKGKNLKEVEIIEHPHSSRFFEYKTKRISEKRIKVNKANLYKFRLKGGGIGPKICRARILRIPASEETIGFDTNVKWKVRYDSTYITKQSKELIRIDTTVINVADRVERVHSQTNLSNSNIASFNLNLPQNQKSDLRTSELVSWAYWIGVGNEGKEAYEQEKKKFLLENASTVSTLVNPVAGLALGAYAILRSPPKGDNIKYWITTHYNGTQHNLAQGNSTIAYGRITDMKQGGFTVTLQNDNIMDGVNVDVKISAVMVTKEYTYRPYKELQVKQYRYPVLSSED